MRYWQSGLFIVLLSLMSNLLAEENGTGTSSITLELGTDDSDTKEAYLDIDLALKNDAHIRLMSGGTKLDSDSEVYETRSRSVGLSSEYDATFVIGVDREYWGNPDTVETETNRFKFGVNLKDWFIQLVYEDRVTYLRTAGSYINRRGIVVNLPEQFELDSNGRGIDISFYGFYPIAINLSYIEYDYNKNVAAFSQYPELIAVLYPPETVSVATGLEAWRRSGDISYGFDWGVIGVAGSQSESAADESVASTGSVYLVWDFMHNWSTTLTLGESGTDTSDETIRFGRAALTHRW